ncbi:unnamed protein product, partial [Mesorhabditis belari]|uniref:Uncharacterized protein n=1 Tax=Mesorhabditis belari TaxID=2138241 RepID=A0AAF3J939_9BILA
MKTNILILIFSCLFGAFLTFRTQSVAVKGKLMCGSEPAKGILVKLIDDDGFNVPDPDDNMGQTKTSNDGSFSLNGSTAELSSIEPELKIYHDCNDEHKPCLRRWLIRIPSRYISDGENPQQVMDLGTLNLEKNFIMKLLLFCVLPLLMARPETAKKTSGTQSISVKGVLRCGSKPAKGVLIKLIDEDFGQDTDDMLGRVHTDENGTFELKGHTTEFTAIDTSLSIYHDCNDGNTPCQRRWRFEIPSKYISTGETPKKTFDIGTWNLEAILPREKHDCDH